MLSTDVSCGGVVIDKDGDGSRLNDRRNGGRKPCGDCDNLVARLDAFMRRQLVSGECCEGDEIGRGAGINEQRVPNAQERCKFFLEGIALGPEREPEIQSGRDSGLHFILCKDATCVRNSGFAGNESGALRVVARAVGSVKCAGVGASGFADSLFENGSHEGHVQLAAIPRHRGGIGFSHIVDNDPRLHLQATFLEGIRLDFDHSRSIECLAGNLKNFKISPLVGI